MTIQRIATLFLLLMLALFLNVNPSNAAPPMQQSITFTGEELLGRPTDTSITINIVPDQDIELYYEYGTASGVYTIQTPPTPATGGEPHEVVISGLTPNTRYYYRMQYRVPGDTGWVVRDEHTFHTQRAEGEAFVFTVTSDSHATFNTAHQTAMTNVLNDQPDFHIDLGDTSLSGNVSSQSAVNSAYLAYRNPLYMDRIGHSVPIFLAAGNHEDEEGWNLDDTPFSPAVGSIQARKAYFPTPIDEGPGGFYSGNTDTLAAINETIYGDEYREDYYAWTWGDALFVVIDPFQYTMANPYGSTAGEGGDDPATGDQWNWTLGSQQFNWFKQTIQNSDAKYKFVFSHNMLGGIPRAISVNPAGYVRGGAEAAAYFEWGGKNADGTEGFASHRDADDFGTTPIHQLMVENGVSAYFHGHDHQYVYETRDGIVYQEVPSPSMSGSGFSGIYSEGDQGDYNTIEMLPNSGHLRVTIAPDQATVDYVRSNQTGVSYTYTIAPNISGPTHELTISTDPAGSGTTNPAAGTHTYAEGANVTILATANSGYTFSGWSGDCSGPGTCTVTMDADKAVTANFSPGGTTITFTGEELLGRPTDSSISISVVPDAAIRLKYDYGTSTGAYPSSTTPVDAPAGQPVVVNISGLTANTKYYYRMQYSTDGGSTWTARPEHSFWTQRTEGSTFTFDVTSDSHVDIMLGNSSNWTSTMNGVASDNPDFLIDLGDTFAMDNGSTSVPLGDTAAAEQRYKDQLPFFNLASASSAIYIVPGNHEQQEAWHLQGTLADSLPVMGKNAEKNFFLNPVNDSFYSGDTSTHPDLSGDQLKQDYYAWTWGDALFVVISPYWTTTTKPYVTTVGGGETDATGSGDRWDWTLGLDQFNWLKQTLEASDAGYKFVFAHQIVGGNGMTSPVDQVNYGHGGVDSANFVEWGGYDTDGTTYAWTTRRPGWGSQPIRQMMEANGVTAFFHGHDHQFAYESLNGMVYQAVPSGSFTGSFGSYTTGGNSGNTIWADSTQGAGRLRVTVSPSQTTVDFIRYNGTSPAYTYTMEPGGEIEPGVVILDGAVSTGTADDVDSIDIAHTTGTGPNRLMLVGVSWNCGTADRSISSVTFTPDGGTAVDLAAVRTEQAGTQLRYSAIYSLLNPPAGVSGTVTVTFSGSVSNGIVAGVANFAGVDQTTPLGTAAGANGNSTAPSVDLTGLNGDELVFDNVFQGASGSSQTLTAGSGQTQRWNGFVGNVRAAASTEPAAGGSVTMSWTAASSSYWAVVAVPIKPASAGPTHDLTLAVNPTGGGATVPAVGTHTYPQDEVVNISATPNAGYVFDSWTGDVAEPGSASTTVTMDAAKTVTANFTAQDYDLTVAVDPSGGGTTTPAVGGPHTYGAGAVVAITAAANSGYVFDHWTGDGIADANAASTTVTMDANKTITAHFTQGPTLILDGAVSTGTADGVSSIDIAHTTGTGPNRLMLVGVSANSYNSARTISSVTFTPEGGSAASLTLVGSIENEAGRLAAIYSLLDPPSGVSGTVTVTFSGSVANGIVVGVANFAGVDQSDPLDDFVSAVGTEASPISVDMPADPGDLVFDTVFLGAATLPSLAVGAGQTQLWNATLDRARGASSTELATTPTTQMNWTASGGASAYYWAVVAVPINPAPAGTTYDLAIATEGSGSGTVTPAVGVHTYPEGTVVTLEATADPDSTFDGWSGDADCADGSVTMDADKTCTATFTLAAPGILGDVSGDNAVDSTDALIVLSCDADIDTSEFCPMNCGDVDADGLVNSTDALVILSYDAGITVPFPVGQPGCPASVTAPPGCTP